MEDREIRAALDRHWAASDADDFLPAEHGIYREDAVLEYPQSGERIRGRHNIQSSRTAQPNRKRFTVRRITGAGDLWVTEYVLSYDGQPSFTVSIMEFLDGKVARETQYFGDPFEPEPSPRAMGRNGCPDLGLAAPTRLCGALSGPVRKCEPGKVLVAVAVEGLRHSSRRAGQHRHQRYVAGPASLVAGANAGAVVAMKILVEQDQVAPMRVGVEPLGTVA